MVSRHSICHYPLTQNQTQVEYQAIASMVGELTLINFIFHD